MATEVLIVGTVSDDALERLARLCERVLEDQNPGRKFIVRRKRDELAEHNGARASDGDARR